MRRVELLQFAQFEWDKNKAELNLLKHGLNFEDGAVALMRPHVEFDVERNGEMRVVGICPHSSRIVAVIFTARGD